MELKYGTTKSEYSVSFHSYNQEIEPRQGKRYEKFKMLTMKVWNRILKNRIVNPHTESTAKRLGKYLANQRHSKELNFALTIFLLPTS